MHIILIPAFNEEQRIAAVIRGIKCASPDADILVVNDGSRDDTAAAAPVNGLLACGRPFSEMVDEQDGCP